MTAPELAAVYRELDLDRLARALAVGRAIASASNEWVVGGRFTQSGKPLLANDPHLRFTAPGLWYLARLVTPELEIAGGTVPGMPFNVVGHNANIAWGLTTTEADVQDLFIERLDPQDQGRYLTPGGAVPFTTRDEVIAIRGSDQPERLRVRETRHGPVISDIDPRIGQTAPAGHVVALAFPALRPDDRTPEAVYWLNRATDWREFNRALSMFHAPVQNLVYGDTSGRIGFLTPGRIPIRAAGDGRQLVPGWTGEFDWTGFIPFRRLPRLVDPPDARIVNANNRLVGGAYPYFISGDWPPSFRAERINQLLDEASQHSPASFAAIQNDAVSLAARELVPTLLALASEGLLSDQAMAATALLADWHGLMARERPEPLIFVAWLRRLGQRLWSDELGALAADYGGLRPRVVQNILAGRTAWCDDVETATLETCADQVGAALEEALALLSERFGDEIEAWRWGEPHQAVFRHPVFGRQALLRRLTDIAIPSDGGPFTINRGVARLAEDDRMFNHVHGPGYRAIYDLGDLAESRFMVATGQSGHPLSPRYDDLTERWRDGAYIRLAGSVDELRLDGIGVLTLEPAP